MKKKIIIYQTFPRIAGNLNNANIKDGKMVENGCGKMNDYTHRALSAIHDLGCNYIWYTGLIQHATRTDYSEHGIPKGNPYIIKGEAGSPYAITDYYAIDPDLATNVEKRMEEFDELISRSHENQLKVIIDFVPNHVAREYHSNLKPETIADFGQNDHTDFAFHPQNNFYYILNHEFAPHIDLGSGDNQYHEYPAKATGNDCFHSYPQATDWYETVKLNYGFDYSDGTTHYNPIPDTWTKMLHILLYWASKKVDGFRCDMAHMVPIEFWEWVIPMVKHQYPKTIFIAEIYTPSLYKDYLFRGHFDYLYDKVGLYDTLRAIIEGKAPASDITYQWQAVEGIQEHMVNFLENHDEQRIASSYFANDPFKAIPALIVSAMMNINPFMLYFAQDLGEKGMNDEGFSGVDGRTSIFDYCSLDKMIRWNNCDRWDQGLLDVEEQKLQTYYRKILTSCNKEKAIREGAFYDLMYANLNQPHFNPNKQYAFIRKYENELLIIAVNFDSFDVDIQINIPQHAFEFFEITPGTYEITNLITDYKRSDTFSPEHPLKTPIDSYDGVIFKIKLNQNRRKK